jgi:uridine kinase
LRARVVLLAGPSGSGKTHLAERSGLPLLDLDHFYKDGADPSLPRHPTLGIVDWDDAGSWDAAGALAAIEAICREGASDVPIYDISRDGRVGHRRFDVGEHHAFVGTGIFAAELVEDARARGLLADAIVVRRSRMKNFARRLRRDLAERRKPPLTVLRRPWWPGRRRSAAARATGRRRSLRSATRPAAQRRTDDGGLRSPAHASDSASIASRSRTAKRWCSHSSSRSTCRHDRVLSGWSGLCGFRRVAASSSEVTVARTSRTIATRPALASSTSS